MALLTTTIGSYPKPGYILTPDKFRARRTRPGKLTKTHGQFRPAQADDFEELLDWATQEVVMEQVNAGVEVPTTGEVRRDHNLDYICRHFDGIDFSQTTGKVTRLTSEEVEVPTITGPLKLGDHFLLREWRIAQSATKRPVKITMPGPLTIADSVADFYYGDEKRLNTDLAEALNLEIHALAEAGCQWIQIDEPLFALEPEKAVAFGIDKLEHCFHHMLPAIVRTVHLCCGYPKQVDEADYLKADPEAYFKLAGPLELSSLQAVSIENAHQPNDLSLLEQFVKTRVVFGVIAVARSRVETVEEITTRLAEALLHIDPERLIVAPDCGLRLLLDRRLVLSKLTNMVTAAHAVG